MTNETRVENNLTRLRSTESLIERHEALMECDDPNDETESRIDRIRRVLADRANAGDDEAVEYITVDLGYDLADLTNFLRKN